MDPRAAVVTSQETMSLAAVYTALDTNRSVELSDEEVAALKEGERQPLEALPEGRRGERPQRPMSALEAASRFDRLVLLGDPGAGKSTFVSHLALRLAQAELQGDGLERLSGWTRGSLVPVHVVLRDLARSPRVSQGGTAAALWDFVEGMLSEADLAAVAPVLRERLGGGALLLLDGLDEVEVEARRGVLDAVTDFALTYQHLPILVTCRVYAYQESQWQLTAFEQATLSPFDEGRIDHFIGSWYAEVTRMGLMSATEAGERAARLREAVRRPDLRALAPNPLLLTMMALLHSSWGRLPEDRVQLYSEIVELLLARWEQSRLGREALMRARLSPRDVRFALEEVAYAAHEGQPAGEGAADVAETLLRGVLQGYLEGDWNRAGDVIRYIRERAGLLLERKPGVYGFPHRTLQEYLAGCHLSVQTDFPSRAADLVREDEVRWRQPFLLAVGKTARAENRVDLALGAVDNLCPREWLEPPADEVAWRCAWLAGEALLEIGADKLRQREAWKTRLERVAGWLAPLLERGALAPVERAAVGRVLGLLGDPRDLDDIVFVPGGPFAMGGRKQDEGIWDDELPQHTVEVADFCISRYPVTNVQYARFVEAGGYGERRYWTEAGWAWRTGGYDSKLPASLVERRPPESRDRPFWWDDPTWNLPNHSVVGVCWFEALAYTRWLTEQLQASSFKLPVWRNGQLETWNVEPETLVARLPTEAKWEKAARGTNGRTYPWGDDWAEDRANTNETGIGRTTAVGAFPAGASPYGALDMSGNVLEWCTSVGYTEAPYPYRADDGREDLERDAVRALRGGSWYYGRGDVRCACRRDSRPDNFLDDVGFRVVFPGSPPAES
jgi:formylglycine-generating enzyme required for sulfatase activity